MPSTLDPGQAVFLAQKACPACVHSFTLAKHHRKALCNLIVQTFKKLHVAPQGIMASLKEDDEMVQEAALNELTELMSMSSEESLTVLPLEQLVPQLVRLHPCTLLAVTHLCASTATVADAWFLSDLRRHSDAYPP